MGKYDVKVRYIFEGTYTVVAEDREEAESMVAEDCGLVLGAATRFTAFTFSSFSSFLYSSSVNNSSAFSRSINNFAFDFPNSSILATSDARNIVTVDKIIVSVISNTQNKIIAFPFFLKR